MAVTAGSVKPIKAVSGSGGTGSPYRMVVPLDVSETISNGDILIVNGTTQDLEDSNAAADHIFGIAEVGANRDAVSAATVDRDFPVGPDVSGNDHVVNVVLALPGVMWEGSCVAGASDETGIYVDNLRPDLTTLRFDFIEADGMACVDISASADDVVIPIAYTDPQFDGVDPTLRPGFGRSAGVGITNPRVLFVIATSATLFA